MKKLTTMLLAFTMSMATLLASCGGGNNDASQSSGNQPSTEGGIAVDLLPLEGLSQDYLPRKDKISQMEGAIDIAIVFDDTLAGWQALANEYMRSLVLNNCWMLLIR